MLAFSFILFIFLSPSSFFFQLSILLSPYKKKAFLRPEEPSLSASAEAFFISLVSTREFRGLDDAGIPLREKSIFSPSQLDKRPVYRYIGRDAGEDLVNENVKGRALGLRVRKLYRFDYF